MTRINSICDLIFCTLQKSAIREILHSVNKTINPSNYHNITIDTLFPKPKIDLGTVGTNSLIANNNSVPEVPKRYFAMGTRKG